MPLTQGGRNVNNLNFTEVPQLEVAPLHIHPKKEVKVLGKDRVFLLLRLKKGYTLLGI